jgi:hypothetical protein
LKETNPPKRTDQGSGVGIGRDRIVTATVIPRKIIKLINYLFFVVFFLRTYKSLIQEDLINITSILSAFLQGIESLFEVKLSNKNDFVAVWPIFFDHSRGRFCLPDGTIGGFSGPIRIHFCGNNKKNICAISRENKGKQVGVSRDLVGCACSVFRGQGTGAAFLREARNPALSRPAIDTRRSGAIRDGA